MQPKTIAFINWHYPGGGGETVTRNLGGYFHGLGYRIVLYAFTLEADILSESDRKLFTIHRLPVGDTVGTQENNDYLCRSLNEEKVDCLIVQGTHQLDFARIRRQVGCRVVFCLHGMPLWEAHMLRARRASDIFNPTLLRKMEFVLVRKPIYRLTDKLERRTLKEYVAMLPHIDRMVFLCPQYAEQMQEALRKCGFSGDGTEPEKFLSIANPLLPASEPVAAPKEKIVLYAGRMCREDKRVDRLLRIWRRIESRHPEWRLLLLGRGKEEEDLKALAASLGIRRAEFCGFQSDLTPYYRKAAFVCLTSNFEGYPMCFTEGQQYGVIPVGFDSFAAMARIADGGRAGIVVPAFSERKYAALLGAALEDDRRQEQMRTACLEAAKEYELEHIGGEWIKLFDEL